MDNREEYHKEYLEALAKCKPLMEEASRRLYWHPVILQYLSLCNIIPVEDPKVTMRISVQGAGGHITLKYNPIWMSKLASAGASMVAYLLSCEALRIALHHCTIRRLNPANIHLLASNLLVCENKMILDLTSDKVAEQLNTIPAYEDVREFIEPLGYEKPTMWCLEKLHLYLNKYYSSLQRTERDKQLSSEIEQLVDEIEGGSSSRSKEELEEELKQKTKELNDERNKESNLRNDKKSRGNGEAGEALDQYFDTSVQNASQMTSEWGENDLIDDKIRQVTNKIASDASNWGNLPGSIKGMIMAANLPKFDPSIIIKHFRHELISEEMYDTRAKVNRRHGQMLPGWRHKMKCSVLFAEDVSGSMSEKDVAIGQGFFCKFIKHAEMWFSYWDCKCSLPVRIKSTFTHKNAGIEVTGGGGTDPKCIIEMLTAEKLKFGGIVVFTDNGFDWERPPQKWANKIFIIGTGSCTKPPDWCKYFLKITDIVKYMEGK